MIGGNLPKYCCILKEKKRTNTEIPLQFVAPMQSGFVTVPTSKYLHYLHAARPMGSALLQSSEKEGKEELTKIEKTFLEGTIGRKGREGGGQSKCR